MAEAPAGPAALFDLSGQVALVTGATRGLGWAIAQALAAAGASVVVNGRDAAAAHARAAQLRDWGLQGAAAPFDVTDPDAAAHAVAGLGRLDILVSNAGGTVRKPLREQTDADWDAVVGTHLTAAWRLVREASRGMAESRYGRVLLVGSINGAVARPGISGYVAAKAGLEGLARALAAELGPDGITVNVLAPGYVPTEGNAALRASDPAFMGRIGARTPVGRWGALPEIGAAALYLCSRAAGFTTGTVLTVDGGLRAVI